MSLYLHWNKWIQKSYLKFIQSNRLYGNILYKYMKRLYAVLKAKQNRSKPRWVNKGRNIRKLQSFKPSLSTEMYVLHRCTEYHYRLKINVAFIKEKKTNIAFKIPTSEWKRYNKYKHQYLSTYMMIFWKLVLKMFIWKKNPLICK